MLELCGILANIMHHKKVIMGLMPAIDAYTELLVASPDKALPQDGHCSSARLNDDVLVRTGKPVKNNSSLPTLLALW